MIRTLSHSAIGMWQMIYLASMCYRKSPWGFITHNRLLIPSVSYWMHYIAPIWMSYSIRFDYISFCQVHFIPVFESGSWVIILFWSLIWCIMSRVFHRSISLTSRDRNTLLMPCYSLIRHRLSLYQSSLSIFILLTFQFIMAYVQFKVAVYYSSLKSLSVAQV